MKQMSLSESGFERKTKRTRKREFLDEMNLVVPWAELVALIAPHARLCPDRSHADSPTKAGGAVHLGLSNDRPQSAVRVSVAPLPDSGFTIPFLSPLRLCPHS
jgi:hypothetical protein